MFERDNSYGDALDPRCRLAAHDLDANRIAGLISVGGQTVTHVAVREVVQSMGEGQLWQSVTSLP